MAWLSLIIVTIFFFAPGFGIGANIALDDIIIDLPLPFISTAFRIPSTGPLKLFFISLGSWAVLWLTPFLIDRWLSQNALRENKPYLDFLAKVKLWNLWDDLVVAFRPVVSNQLAVILSKFLLWFLIIRAILIYLFQAALDSLFPFLISKLTSQFGTQFIPILQGFFSQGLSDLLNLKPDNGVALWILCILVLIANRAFQGEQRSRIELRIQHNQIARKLKQQDIVIPSI